MRDKVWYKVFHHHHPLCNPPVVSNFSMCCRGRSQNRGTPTPTKMSLAPKVPHSSITAGRSCQSTTHVKRTAGSSYATRLSACKDDQSSTLVETGTTASNPHKCLFSFCQFYLEVCAPAINCWAKADGLCGLSLRYCWVRRIIVFELHVYLWKEKKSAMSSKQVWS